MACNTTAKDILTWPAWLVKEGLFWSQAKAAGQADRISNERAQQEGMAKAFGH